MKCPQKPADALHVGGSLRKTACMSKQKYDEVVKSVADVLNSLPSTCSGNFCPQADWAGCILRMTGHDFMDFKDGVGGADGCTDMTEPDNAGLPECLASGDNGRMLTTAYIQHCGDVSLADFLVIAGEAVMMETRKHVLAQKPGSRPLNFQSTFKFGRATNIEDCRLGLLPNPVKSCNEVKVSFIDRLRLNVSESAALMGVHTLGRARTENSGFDGWWSDPVNSRMFNNDYYVSMITKGWTPEHNVGPKKRSQWSRSDIGRITREGEKEMMLNTDLCLAFDHKNMDIDAAIMSCCAWMDPPFQFGGESLGVDQRVLDITGNTLCGGPSHRNGQPVLGEPMREQCCQLSPDPKNAEDCGSFPNMAAAKLTGFAADAVMQFAADEDAWLQIFERAWVKVTENGHEGKLSALKDTCEM